MGACGSCCREMRAEWTAHTLRDSESYLGDIEVWTTTFSHHEVALRWTSMETMLFSILIRQATDNDVVFYVNLYDGVTEIRLSYLRPDTDYEILFYYRFSGNWSEKITLRTKAGRDISSKVPVCIAQDTIIVNGRVRNSRYALPVISQSLAGFLDVPENNLDRFLRGAWQRAVEGIDKRVAARGVSESGDYPPSENDDFTQRLEEAKEHTPILGGSRAQTKYTV